ncbi:nitroreductase/quinone reductase family protein [Conexibacter sp. SYSU D00693]|uniref:nitroreductase/quinone reductase family protein n=1 Tax=Conexibacter sp. SYSU D00693 TaxID=2812560 RepID=UPI00196BAFD7|nr:nitroreductase/quinone reductase family protein [Conexibacter sp. SYSU D00693]
MARRGPDVPLPARLLGDARAPRRPGTAPVGGPRALKRRVSRAVTRRAVNPLVRRAIEAGAFPTNWVLLETTGRRTGRPVRTPVGNGLRDGVFWIVTEHGWGADYVKNLRADPRVRLKVGRRWLSGTAQVMPDEDPYARLRALRRPLNDALLLAVGTEQLVVRVDLDQA